MKYIMVLGCCLLALKAFSQAELSSYYDLHWEDFFELPQVSQPVDLQAPALELLDAAIFHVTNEARESLHLPPFLYAKSLHQASAFHAQSMIAQDFYGHENRTDTKYFLSNWRIMAFGGSFGYTGENIGQYQTINTPIVYCPFKNKDGSWQYLDCKTEKPCLPHTYLSLARYAVDKWMHSASHRANILNPHFTFLACAARVGPHPYTSRMAPFARFTQNFGGNSTHTNQAHR